MTPDQHSAARDLVHALTDYRGGDLSPEIRRAATTYARTWGGKLPDPIRSSWKQLDRDRLPNRARELADALAQFHHPTTLETPEDDGDHTDPPPGEDHPSVERLDSDRRHPDLGELVSTEAESN